MRITVEKIKPIFGAILAIGVIISVQPAPSECAVKPAITITISSDRMDISPGSPLPVEITLLNTSNHDVVVGQDLSRKGEFVYTIKVKEDTGSEASKTDYHRAHRGEPTKKPILINESLFQVTVQPGKTLKDDVDISTLYDLTQPGKYTVQVERVDPISKTVVKSNSIIVTVTPWFVDDDSMQLSSLLRWEATNA
ncbi:MAG: hypothetical protein JWO71_1185 [Candidatus Acidoferrum typicum]|nr:hypothetical protein [Candidatus Acidoferrum typicum]